MENPSKFSFYDFIQLCELISTLRESTVPANEHVDVLGLDGTWKEVNFLMAKMGSCFKEQMIDKEYLEDLTGKTIRSFEKVYDENGVMTGIKIVPVTPVNYIEVNLQQPKL
jgi:hypothetical protein